jgi:hypothetical protein
MSGVLSVRHEWICYIERQIFGSYNYMDRKIIVYFMLTKYRFYELQNLIVITILIVCRIAKIQVEKRAAHAKKTP